MKQFLSRLINNTSAAAAALVLSACADHVAISKFKAARTAVPLPMQKTEDPVPTVEAKAETRAEPEAESEPLLWEKSKAESVMWSTYAKQIIGDEAAAALLPGSIDVGQFCPKYHSLEREQKINFWAYLISAVAKFESNFKTTTRFKEPGMGTDPVTGAPVYSEGLLQLSYQDTRAHKYCEFDWKKDRSLPLADPRRSILDPMNNLKCGILILAKQIKIYNRISILNGAYWSVLRPPGANYSKVLEIKALTRKLSFC